MSLGDLLLVTKFQQSRFMVGVLKKHPCFALVSARAKFYLTLLFWVHIFYAMYKRIKYKLKIREESLEGYK